MSKPPCSCGHPHSFHDTGWDAAGCMHRSCSCNAYREANKVVGDLALAGPMYEDHDLREENVRLRQRVEELERAPRCCADTIPPGCRTCRCADAAEAKLARCVEAAQKLGGWVGDVLRGWEAKRQLDQGFGGMGHNILIEAAARYQSIHCWSQVRKHYDALCAALAAAKGSEK